MAIGQRLICAAAAAGLAVGFVALRRGVSETPMLHNIADVAILAAAAGVAGYWLFPRFVYPRARNWLWPVLGGLLVAALTMVLGLMPDAVREIAEGRVSLFGATLTTLIGALYAMILAGPFFVAGGLVLNAGFRIFGRRSA